MKDSGALKSFNLGHWALRSAALFVLASSFVQPAQASEPLKFDGGATPIRASASASPNPAWSAERAVDGDFGPIKGWLGMWMEGGPSPWIRLDFPRAVRLEGIGIAQAGFKEAGENRYLRPRRIAVAFDRSDARLVYELRDRELTVQELGFEARVARSVTVWIESVYERAQTNGMTGFQEIELYGSPLETPQAPEEDRHYAGPGGETWPPGDALGWEAAPDGDETPESAADGAIDEKEARILDTVRLLLQQLNDYFSEN